MVWTDNLDPNVYNVTLEKFQVKCVDDKWRKSFCEWTHPSSGPPVNVQLDPANSNSVILDYE